MAKSPTPSDQTSPRSGERIAKLLARAGIASRREVERMIADGRIALDGVVLETPATVLPHLRGVTVDGKPVAAEKVLYAARDEGLVTLEDGTTARRERLSYVDTITWKNPRTNASLTWSVPREEVRVVPVHFQ